MNFSLIILNFTVEKNCVDNYFTDMADFILFWLKTAMPWTVSSTGAGVDNFLN